MNIRASSIDDLSVVRRLYDRVAAVPGGIARLEDEIDDDYVRYFLQNASDRGLGLVSTDDSGDAIAEIHAYTPPQFCFSHVLSDLTIVVDPGAQGCGMGRRIFERFMQMVQDECKHISRVELVARESNWKAIRFYESLGFHKEGVFAGRIRNVDGSTESDIPMAWVRED